MLRVLTVAGVLLVVAQLHRASGGVVSIELHHTFALGAAEIGLVTGAMLLASAVVQVPAGLAFDRFGTRRTVSAMTVVALLGTLLFAAADSFLGLALARFLIGAGFAGAVTSIMLLAMHWAPPERFSTVAATVFAAASLVGGLLATTPLALALQALGWAWTYLLVAALCAVVIGLSYAVIRDSPSGATVRRGGESLAAPRPELRADRARRPAGHHDRPRGALARLVAQWLCGLLVGLTGGGSALGSAQGYRLVFAFLAGMLLLAILVYRAAPERPAVQPSGASAGAARRVQPEPGAG